jgi:DNA-binding CsgD family transcriptional regulator
VSLSDVQSPTAPELSIQCGARLTAGELRVARMAAAGATNREIAEALVVTRKAVEWHLTNAYRKLGVRSRADLPRSL